MRNLLSQYVHHDFFLLFISNSIFCENDDLFAFNVLMECIRLRVSVDGTHSLASNCQVLTPNLYLL